MSGFRDIKRLTENPFLNMYHMEALNNKKEPFSYYFASRKNRENLACVTGETKPDGVLIYAVCKENPEQIVMIRQYRYPLGRKIMELPAGLIDGKESPESAAIRELKEETGMTLEIYEDGSDLFRKPFFSAQGLTDECCSTVFGFATGTGSASFQEETEDIQVLIADKAQVKTLLRTEEFSMRSAYLLMNFLQSNPSNPFAFLHI